MKFRLDIPASLMLTIEADSEEAAIKAAIEWSGHHEAIDIDNGIEPKYEARLYPMPSGTEADKIEVSDIWEEDCDEAE